MKEHEKHRTNISSLLLTLSHSSGNKGTPLRFVGENTQANQTTTSTLIAWRMNISK